MLDKERGLRESITWIGDMIDTVRGLIEECDRYRELTKKQRQEILKLRAQVRELGGSPVSIPPKPNIGPEAKGRDQVPGMSPYKKE